MTTPVAGEFISNTVRLVRPLGAGGMGNVWLAEHHGTQKYVVVKLMPVESASDGELVARFHREATAASMVQSPHIVRTFEYGVTPSGLPFLVMEHLEGEDLRQRLERNGGPLPLPEVVGIVTQLAIALSAAHEASLIHRDIKPENIFFTKKGVVKVLDFGIAKSTSFDAYSNLTRTGTLVGTPNYMSPEQVVGAKNIDRRTDVWSLGAVGFELLTNQRAFDADTIAALVMAICHAPMPVPTGVNPQLPPAVDAWFARACARDVTQRYPTVRALAEGLEATLKSMPQQNQAAEAFEETALAAPLVDLPQAPARQPMVQSRVPTVRVSKPPVALFIALGVGSVVLVVIAVVVVVYVL